MSRARILVVEDERSERDAMARLLRLEDFDVTTADGPDKALAMLDRAVDLVISDVRMTPTSGLDLLRFWKNKRPDTPFIMVTAYGEVGTAVEAMKLGASDYLTKPINPDELLILIDKCLEGHRKDRRIEELSRRLDDRLGLENIVGRSKPMRDVFARVRRAARTDSTILVVGESGTGKELIAEAIHQNSRRRNGPFVAVNIAAVPPNLIESELFGHVKGSFTGATAGRVGRFEAADGGTVFIDEIGDFALESQAKLLRVLETRTITPVGGNEEKQVDVRVVTATSRDLEELIAGKQFREDLYYRLSVITIMLPPLRERRDDIPLLVRHFLDRFCQANDLPDMSCDPELMHFLERFDWPGNVRQLHNCLESMAVMAQEATLTLSDLPANLRGDTEQGSIVSVAPGITMDQVERDVIIQTLERFEGNRTRAAESLGISVRTLQRKLKKWDISTPQDQEAD